MKEAEISHLEPHTTHLHATRTYGTPLITTATDTESADSAKYLHCTTCDFAVASLCACASEAVPNNRITAGVVVFVVLFSVGCRDTP